MLSSQFAEPNCDQESINEDFTYRKSTILMRLDKLLKQIVTENCDDIKSLNLIIQLLANIAHTGKSFAEKVTKETCVTDVLKYLLEHKG